MNLIEKLGLEKCKQIVDGAPKTATDVILDGSQVFYGSGLIALRGAEQFFKLHSIRTAIADHDHTDHCTDIRNHISPLTEVIER
ncbi:hypothetical protein [Acinetobacter sp. ANC 5414]|uniref:hypothetical protein n=1 Tax=Acinetobacter sp. ANC 5414 TaxID=2731251 RepID=UPI0014904028|nr:hypothetical protein [Acinetobacter sp. ANC 5414]NNH00234.1 hypothetical protein [Acinetobacter sp. ANC 5414]